MVVVAVAILVGVSGYHFGYTRSDDSWKEREAKWTQAINQERWDQQRKLDKVHAEAELLRLDLDKVRTATQKAIEHVAPDDKCQSVPSSIRGVWNATP